MAALGLVISQGPESLKTQLRACKVGVSDCSKSVRITNDKALSFGGSLSMLVVEVVLRTS